MGESHKRLERERARRRRALALRRIGRTWLAVWRARWPLGLCVLGFSVWAASELLVARSEPRFRTQPAIVFLTDLRLPRSERLAPEIDVTVRAQPGLLGGCSPVHVHVDVDTRKLSRYGRLTAGQAGRFGLGVMSPGRVWNFRTTGGSVESSASIDRVTETGSSFAPGHPPVYVAAGRIHVWPVPPYFPPLKFDFDADWAVARSAGSCFVALPALVGSQPLEDFSHDVSRVARIPQQRALASRSALAGATTLVERGANVSRQPGDTLPAPDDPQLARWRCQVDHKRSYVRPGPVGDFDPIRVFGRRERTCAAQAVLTRSSTQEWGVFIAFMLAVLASFGLQLIYDGVFNRKPEPA
jgi:hypothetical protein